MSDPTLEARSDTLVERLRSEFGDSKPATRAEIADVYAALIRSHDAMVALAVAVKNGDPGEWRYAARVMKKATRAILEGVSRFAGGDGNGKA